MNAVPANTPRPVHLVPASPLEWLPAANDAVEGIEVTYLDVEQIELATDSVQPWRPA